jgi:hypothetical protein
METPITEPDAADQPAPEPTPAPAEPTATDLTDRVAELERDLRDTRQTLQQAQTRTHIHRALAGTSPIDADAVALVVETELAKGESEPDAAAVARAVEEVRRTRPALFRSAGPARTGPMAARVERPATRLEDAAAHAAKRGDRASLMHYLRLKRAS